MLDCTGGRVVDNSTSKPFRSTYYDDRMRASPALLRTRAPYLVKNTITGIAICSLVIGICAL
jgi:cytochrome c oxidase assembly factor 3